MPNVGRLVASLGAVLWLCLGNAFAQEQEKQRSPNEAEQILKDAQKQQPETAKEISECEKQWDAHTQMTKEEWAASCRTTLRYFREKP
ncbi:MAG TPA: hypothetical protein VLW88_01020 [Hyphomicrobium sp.]|nr:hypothetical protein [Hyphomicrobium sp.]